MNRIQHILAAIAGIDPKAAERVEDRNDAISVGKKWGRHLAELEDRVRMNGGTVPVRDRGDLIPMRRACLAATNRGRNHRDSFEAGLAIGYGDNLTIADVLERTKKEGAA